MKFKTKDGARRLHYTDDFNDQLRVVSHGDGDIYVFVNDEPGVKVSSKKARKLAEAILAELGR